MSSTTLIRSRFRLVLTIVAALALLAAVPTMSGVPTVSAQTPGITSCPTGTFLQANVNCSTFSTVFCPGGGLAGPQQACPINPPLPSILSTSTAPTVLLNPTQGCANGIVLSVTQTCPNGGATVPTTTAAKALLQGSGHYCNLPSGGQVWVSAGSSDADMGCTGNSTSGSSSSSSGTSNSSSGSSSNSNTGSSTSGSGSNSSTGSGSGGNSGGSSSSGGG